jgi:hypothetical protein
MARYERAGKETMDLGVRLGEEVGGSGCSRGDLAGHCCEFVVVRMGGWRAVQESTTRMR